MKPTPAASQKGQIPNLSHRFQRSSLASNVGHGRRPCAVGGEGKTKQGRPHFNGGVIF
jgi:hypothetical protein